jgi:hypothetical protein
MYSQCPHQQQLCWRLRLVVCMHMVPHPCAAGGWGAGAPASVLSVCLSCPSEEPAGQTPSWSTPGQTQSAACGLVREWIEWAQGDWSRGKVCLCAGHVCVYGLGWVKGACTEWQGAGAGGHMFEFGRVPPLPCPPTQQQAHLQAGACVLMRQERVRQGGRHMGDTDTQQLSSTAAPPCTCRDHMPPMRPQRFLQQER